MKIQFTAIILAICSLGISQTPELINDINPNTTGTDPNGALNGSVPRNLLEFNNDLFFLATPQSPVRWKLYKGYGDNLKRLDQSIAGFPESISEMTVFNDSIFFVSSGELYATSTVPSIRGNEVKKIDTKRLITTTTSEPITQVRDLVVFQGKLHYTGNAPGVGRELFYYKDGVSLLVSEVRTGTTSFPIEFLTVVNNSLLFREQGKDRWWQYTGTGKPRILRGTDYSAIKDWVVYDNKLYFTAQTTMSQGGLTRLFVTDGNSAPVVPQALKSIINLNKLGIYQNKLVFDGKESTFSMSRNILGLFDGTTITKIDKNGYAVARSFTENNDTLYFSASNNTNDYELWRYVEGGVPSQVVNINPSGNSLPDEMFSFKNNLFFSANDGTNGKELWAIGPDFKNGLTSLFHSEKQKETLSIYPNPASDIIHTEKGKGEIIDAKGNKFSINSNGIVDITSFQKGVYIININGKSTRFIKL